MAPRRSSSRASETVLLRDKVVIVSGVGCKQSWLRWPSLVALAVRMISRSGVGSETYLADADF